MLKLNKIIILERERTVHQESLILLEKQYFEFKAILKAQIKRLDFKIELEKSKDDSTETGKLLKFPVS